MINRRALRRFFKLYFYRLNNGAPSGTGIITAEEFAEENRSLPVKKEKWKLNLLLFILTLCTTTLAGAVYTDNIFDSIISGLPYSLTLLTILGFHEFGHYFAAKRFGVRATLPYFIPFPSIVGTMGAVIKTRSPIPHRRALFYIGVMGPIPGFIVSLVAVITGVMLSEVLPLPPAEGIIPIFGNSLLFGFIVEQIHGTIPAGFDIALHPFAWAGWIGFLVTSLNLIPIGQLDGGHILYSLIGRKQVYFGWAALAAMVVLTFIWPGWGVWIFLTLFVLMVAHPRIPEREELSFKEKVAGWLCMVILVITFIPVPVEIY
ncbi:MAG: site-2 protease family protein [Spirochaetae bacterium HGW-Spirochaetae-5]|nr:MAG: site-2 protease family protein [Spirochaetae bacterium HGW-Spirochaetae-5]